MEDEIAEANKKTAEHLAAQEEFLITVSNLLDKIQDKRKVIEGEQAELDKLYHEVFDAQFTGTLPDSPLIKRLIS